MAKNIGRVGNYRRSSRGKVCSNSFVRVEGRADSIISRGRLWEKARKIRGKGGHGSDNLINQSVSDRLRSGPSFSSSLFCYLAPDASLFTLCSRFAYPNEARSVPESINRRFSFRLLNTRHPLDPPRICQESKNLYRWPGLSLLPWRGKK